MRRTLTAAELRSIRPGDRILFNENWCAVTTADHHTLPGCGLTADRPLVDVTISVPDFRQTVLLTLGDFFPHAWVERQSDEPYRNPALANLEA